MQEGTGKRKINREATFWKQSGDKVEEHFGFRELQALLGECGWQTISGLACGEVGQANDLHTWQPPADEALDSKDLCSAVV
jgi:hypothetical protein